MAIIQLFERAGAMILLAVLIVLTDGGLPELQELGKDTRLQELILVVLIAFSAILTGLFLGTYVWTKGKMQGPITRWVWAYSYRDSIATMLAMSFVGGCVYYGTAFIHYPLSLMTDQYAWMVSLFLAVWVMEWTGNISTFHRMTR